MVKTVRNYRLLKALGHGSFAVVYRAIDTNTNDTVAIKEISRSKIADERSKKHLDAEIRLLKEFNHSNIVRLIDHMASTNNIYLVFEYCGGGDLRVYIDKFGRLSEHTTRYFLLQLCDGLVYLNERRMIHRDLKPQNILLTEQSPQAQLKIADFGFVKYVEEASVAATMCGTPLYMAPEIVEHFEYDAKVDMWSLGCILFEMLVGKTVFLGSTQAEVLSNVKAQDVVFPPHISVSEQIIGLLQKLLKRTPASRASVVEVAATCELWRKDYEPPSASSTAPAASATDDQVKNGSTKETAEARPAGGDKDLVAGVNRELGGREMRADGSIKQPVAVDTKVEPTGHSASGSKTGVGSESSLPYVQDGRVSVEDNVDAVKTPQSHMKATTGTSAARNRSRTVSLDTAKAMIAYTQSNPQDGRSTNHEGNVVGINNPRRHQTQPSMGSPSAALVHLGSQGVVNSGTDSKDDDSGWEIINHPPPTSGIGGLMYQQGNTPTPPHGRRRSGGSIDFVNAVDGSNHRQNINTTSRPAPSFGQESPNYDAVNPQTHRLSSSHKSPIGNMNVRDTSREDIALFEWCKRVSTMVVRVADVADGLIKRAVASSRRQFLLKLTPDAIHELRLEMLSQHFNDNTIDCVENDMPRRPPPTVRQSSISRVKSQLNEFTALVNAGFLYFHIIDYLRPAVNKTAVLKGGSASLSASRHNKNSPTSLSASPGGGGILNSGPQNQPAAVDRVLKHLSGLLENLQLRSGQCLTCCQNMVALLEQDEARGRHAPGDVVNPSRLGAGLDSLIEGVQLTKAPAPEVLIYTAAQQCATDGSVYRSLGNYKQALNSLDNAQILLDYILLGTKDSIDRSTIENFIRLIRDEVSICRQHDSS